MIMKKLLLVLVAVIGLSFAANAQNAIGGRFGGGQGFGAEVSYLHGMNTGRIELDLGYKSWTGASIISLTGIYQYVGNLTGQFNWFAGVGANLGMWTGGNNAQFGVAVVGQAGVEFVPQSIPFQFSLDIRPKFYFLPATEFEWGDIAFGIRYVF